jgi:hypothetical protein
MGTGEGAQDEEEPSKGARMRQSFTLLKLLRTASRRNMIERIRYEDTGMTSPARHRRKERQML